MYVEKYYQNGKCVSPPKIYIGEDVYLTRIDPGIHNKRTLNILTEVDAVGYVIPVSDGCHSKYQCSVALHCDGEIYQCTQAKRKNELQSFLLTHVDHTFEIQKLKQTSLSYKQSFSSLLSKDPSQSIFNSLSFMVSCDSLPLNKINDEFIINLIYSSIMLGQKNPNVPIVQLFPHFSQTKIRTRILDLARSFKEKIIKQYKFFLTLEW